MWASSWWTVSKWTGDRWAAVAFGLLSGVLGVLGLLKRQRRTKAVWWPMYELILEPPKLEQVDVTIHVDGRSIERLAVSTFFIKNQGPDRIDERDEEGNCLVSVQDGSKIVTVNTSRGRIQHGNGPASVLFHPAPLEPGEKYWISVVHTGGPESYTMTPIVFAKVGQVRRVDREPVADPIGPYHRVLWSVGALCIPAGFLKGGRQAVPTVLLGIALATVAHLPDATGALALRRILGSAPRK
jgi:hypothetical protein